VELVLCTCNDGLKLDERALRRRRRRAVNRKPIRRRAVNRKPVRRRAVNRKPVRRRTMNRKPVRRRTVNRKPNRRRAVNRKLVSITMSVHDIIRISLRCQCMTRNFNSTLLIIFSLYSHEIEAEICSVKL
jgi:hypothetical protein